VSGHALPYERGSPPHKPGTNVGPPTARRRQSVSGASPHAGPGEESGPTTELRLPDRAQATARSSIRACGSRGVMVGLVTTRKSDRSGVAAPLDVKTLLASVEAAPPVDAAEVLAAALTDSLEARDVSFLIADYSGRSLIRLSHVRRMNADDDDLSRERGQAVTLAGTPHGRALAEQDVQIVEDSDGFRVFAPVTSRGEAVGVLELGLDAEPDQQALAIVSAWAHALAYIVLANRRF